ncbi:phosphoglycerate mutase family protein [Marinobacter santoriniensis NKSG1]|uniref:Phosphoglycerate mutase family protein n=1 Tax=Marinobacter santoriniensis NKSG1 TaxID=1288826 RepID=M7D975_9GAMM|nr:histidine phosphatase family protein [Marinobacter santoriniensis]EMP57273.1 phosphoglycerate mutase family protein [Marinobacter santoriniensis NKSG1]
MIRKLVLGLTFSIIGFAVAVNAAASDGNAVAWQALRDGEAILILRHALAPGTGDPANFTLNDCSTQRNLNETGREQARSWKPFLAEHGIEEARVYTSQWCRTRDTAMEMEVGSVSDMPSLNSFFQNRGDRLAQTRATIAQVNALGPGLPVVLVSHQVNITALAGIYPSSNEGVILALPLSDEPSVLARVTPGR